MRNSELVKKIAILIAKQTGINIFKLGNGILAGGAVANAIYDLKYGTTTKINDLDIFVPMTIETSQTMPERDNSYLGTHRMIHSTRSGILNIVEYKMSDSPANAKYTTENIIWGFDLNCCHAGIDLSTMKLSVTPLFKQFLTSRQITIANHYTPLHTYARAQNKFMNQSNVKLSNNIERITVKELFFKYNKNTVFSEKIMVVLAESPICSMLKFRDYKDYAYMASIHYKAALQYLI